VAAAKDKSSTNAQAEVTKQIEMAKRLTLSLFRTSIGERYSVGTLLEGETIGTYEPPRTAQAAQAFNTGIELKVIRNRYAQIQVNRIGLCVNYTGNVAVKAWDLFSGAELYSEPVTVAAGIPTFVNLEWTFDGRGDSRDIFIGYDATAVASYNTQFGGAGCGTCNGGSLNLKHLQAYTRRAATGSNPQGTLLPQNGTSGLMLDVSLVCNMDNYICSFGTSLAPVIWYRAGELICNYLYYSKRLSPTVAPYKEQHKELAELYAASWQKEYGVLLSNVSIPKGDCFKCQSKAQIVSRLP
jgi:hypothetical protein